MDVLMTQLNEDQNQIMEANKAAIQNKTRINMVTPIAQTRLTEEDSVYESSKGFLSGLKHHSRNQTQVNPTLKEMR